LSAAIAASIMIASLVIALGAVEPEPPQRSLRGSASIQVDLEDGTTARFTIPSGTFKASVHEITDGPQRLSFLASSPVAAWRWDVTGEILIDIHLPDPPPPPDDEGDGELASSDFDAPLSGAWDTSGSVSVTEGKLHLEAVAPADSWATLNDTTRAWQVHSGGAVYASAWFASDVPEHAMQGLHVAGDGWHLRCEIQARGGRKAFFVGLRPGGPEALTSAPVAQGVRGLMISWDGTDLTATHSIDGEAWTRFAGWRPPSAPTEIGLYAGVSAGAPVGTRFRAAAEWFRALGFDPPPPPDDGGGGGTPWSTELGPFGSGKEVGVDVQSWLSVHPVYRSTVTTDWNDEWAKIHSVRR